MPISREQVRTLCTPDEFEMYTASLRLSLAGMPPARLRSCIRRTRRLIIEAHSLARRGRPVKLPPRCLGPRKRELLAGALSRFEGRLCTLQAGTPARRHPRP